MLDERLRPAPVPRELCPSVPEDLDALCVSLLRRNESEQAGAPEVLRAFGADPPAASPWRDTGFVRRARELAALREALAQVRGKGPRLVRVLGSSGIGKSALIHRFVEEAEAAGAVVLSGRCDEREAVPFKALDIVVDALARYLDAAKVDAVLPRDAHALMRMFPVLGRADAFSKAPVRELPGPPSSAAGPCARCANSSPAWQTARPSWPSSTMRSGATRTARRCSTSWCGRPTYPWCWYWSPRAPARRR
jgi:hypothetical protein